MQHGGNSMRGWNVFRARMECVPSHRFNALESRWCFALALRKILKTLGFATTFFTFFISILRKKIYLCAYNN